MQKSSKSGMASKFRNNTYIEKRTGAREDREGRCDGQPGSKLIHEILQAPFTENRPDSGNETYVLVNGDTTPDKTSAHERRSQTFVCAATQL